MIAGHIDTRGWVEEILASIEVPLRIIEIAAKESTSYITGLNSIIAEVDTCHSTVREYHNEHLPFALAARGIIGINQR